MAGKEITIEQKQIQKYLESYYKKKITISKYERLGSGWVAVGYKVKFTIDGKKTKQVAIRTLKPVDFSHDYSSDRASYFLLQHDTSKLIPNHIESYGVIGINSSTGELTDVSQNSEFFQILEWASGEEYFNDLERIFNENTLSWNDIVRARQLGKYLAELHNIEPKLEDDVKKSLYKRHTRDIVGSVFLMDVIDTYPEEINFITKAQLNDFVSAIYTKRESLKSDFNRIRKIHGDFHPGNIRFDTKNKLSILDASRAIWGEPADDVASILINYIWYSFKLHGEVDGFYKYLISEFWNSYCENTSDREIINHLPLFIAIRSIVLNHPIFFNVTDEFRAKFHGFCLDLLEGRGNLEEVLR
jgi:hypothetical protein